uniref:Uncharacterized protein n=1 Tax=Chromera velia CCMP2878 TaxID=1169474 RepID=A0A0G4H9B3_9ALVE|eukprot:Cvel_25219.t1-p1 / transcript=Cvel_25219.t1 / gene=Cvel_25219 / organism=Chromera_velia_CCMP2878 / gene_product=hypothetical protein / transcript_product=hypothetical protein / location=Cvel_scaffold2827:19604-22491(+) / protein_length=71 / sequence_SO=supercontig / SO=protein_coding / is_pseudo=false
MTRNEYDRSGGEGSLPSSSSSPSEAGEGGKAKAARAFPSDSGGSLANGDLTVSIPAAKKRVTSLCLSASLC